MISQYQSARNEPACGQCDAASNITQTPLVDLLTKRIEELVGHATVTNELIRSFLIRAGAVAAEAGQKNAPCPLPSGSFNRLDATITDLQSVLNEAGVAAGKLSIIA